jgi:hypothetical protein
MPEVQLKLNQTPESTVAAAQNGAFVPPAVIPSAAVPTTAVYPKHSRTIQDQTVSAPLQAADQQPPVIPADSGQNKGVNQVLPPADDSKGNDQMNQESGKHQGWQKNGSEGNDKARPAAPAADSAADTYSAAAPAQ